MLKIGNLNIKYNTMLSPMASITDISFRKLLDEIGSIGLMVSEMISAEGLNRLNKRTLDMMRPFKFRTPQFIQLFGSESESFVNAVKYIEGETNFSGIDINMGCPANKVVKRGAGAFLLKDSKKIASIIREIRRNTKLPLTVKIRLGYSKVNVFEIIDVLENEGVDAITVHFRLKSSRYNEKANWEYASLIKERIRTVFIGNGDIWSCLDAKEKLKFVDALMIGRGAASNPLIFAEIAGEKIDGLRFKQILERLLELIKEYYKPEFRLAKLKAYTRFMVHNKINSKKLRQRIYNSESFKEAGNYFKSIGL